VEEESLIGFPGQRSERITAMSPPRTRFSIFVRQVLLLVLVALPLATLTAGCGSSTQTTPTAPTPPQGPATLQIIDLTVGDGDTLNAGNQGTFIFTLWQYDPAGVDSKGAGVQTGTIQIRPGITSVITGVQQGITGMMVHGKRRLIIPPSLAYGATGSSNGAIAPNAWVVFEFELLEVRDCAVVACQV
jgi:FKBP-type peptidyl-prolyl cis-trans isomerase FkpA